MNGKCSTEKTLNSLRKGLPTSTHHNLLRPLRFGFCLVVDIEGGIDGIKELILLHHAVWPLLQNGRQTKIRNDKVVSRCIFSLIM